VSALVDLIARTPDCLLLPAAGQPSVTFGHALPDDLRQFYESCGGASLFVAGPYSVAISPPSQLISSNLAIIGQPVLGDISDSWYIVARAESGEAISIDLDAARLGRCYDSFWDVHGIAGSCPVIAVSFTELIGQLLDAGGGRWYWLEPSFKPLGDAYAM